MRGIENQFHVFQIQLHIRRDARNNSAWGAVWNRTIHANYGSRTTCQRSQRIMCQCGSDRCPSVDRTKAVLVIHSQTSTIHSPASICRIVMLGRANKNIHHIPVGKIRVCFQHQRNHARDEWSRR